MNSRSSISSALNRSISLCTRATELSILCRPRLNCCKRACRPSFSYSKSYTFLLHTLSFTQRSATVALYFDIWFSNSITWSVNPLTLSFNPSFSATAFPVHLFSETHLFRAIRASVKCYANFPILFAFTPFFFRCAVNYKNPLEQVAFSAAHEERNMAFSTPRSSMKRRSTSSWLPPSLRPNSQKTCPKTFSRSCPFGSATSFLVPLLLLDQFLQTRPLLTKTSFSLPSANLNLHPQPLRHHKVLWLTYPQSEVVPSFVQ